MRPAKLHELTLPTKFGLWFKYIYNTELASTIGIERFTELLLKRQAIELVDQKGITLCKTLDATKIKEAISELYLNPYPSFWDWLSRLARTKATDT